MHEPMISESCSENVASQRIHPTSVTQPNILTTLLSTPFTPSPSGTPTTILDSLTTIASTAASLDALTSSAKQLSGSQNGSTESSTLNQTPAPILPSTSTPSNSDLQRKIDFNQFIKDRIQERILKRKVLKAKLLKLNNMRTVLERLLSNHHQNLYYMGLKLDEEEMFDAKLDSLDESSREKATFYKAQILDLRSQMNDVMTEIKVTFVEFNKL